MFYNNKKRRTFAAERVERYDRGQVSPILLKIRMIEIDKIKEIVAQEIEGTEMFVVEIDISMSNKISVLVDSWKSVLVSDCIKISKKIESSIDREENDYALEVSSSGLDQPFLVPQQYEKNIGNNVEIITNDGLVHKGKLISNAESGIEIEFEKKVKIEGKKKKELVIEKSFFLFENIKSTKVEISFK